MSNNNQLATTFAGGGRVLSLILAGTLAVGMAPAVSIAVQTAEPTQAWAEETLSTATVTLTGEGINPDGDGGYYAVFTNQPIESFAAAVEVDGTKIDPTDIQIKVIEVYNGNVINVDLSNFSFDAIQYLIRVEPSANAQKQFAPVEVNFNVRPHEMGFNLDKEQFVCSHLLDYDEAQKLISLHVEFTNVIESDICYQDGRLVPWIKIDAIDNAPDGTAQTISFKIDTGGYHRQVVEQHDPLSVTINVDPENGVDDCYKSFGNYTYYIKNGNAVITAYSGSEANVEIPASINGYNVTELNSFVFENNNSIDTVTIPKGVVAVSCGCFRDSSVRIINLPSTWENDGWFERCPKLEAINVSEENPNYCSVNGVLFNKSMTNLYTYPGNKPESAFEIPDTVTYMKCSFEDALHIETITVPDSVTWVDCAFRGPSVKTVNFGKSFPDWIIDLSGSHNLDGRAFGEGVEQIVVDKDNPNYLSEAGILYNKNKTRIIAYPSARVGSSIEMSPSVIDIGSGAFGKSVSLEEVIFPAKILSMDRAAFDSDCGLKRIVFREGLNVAAIGSYALNCWGTVLIGDESVRQAVEESNLDVERNYLDIDLSSLSLTIPDQTYDGSAVEPDITFTGTASILEKGKDYEVVYENNTAPGEATLTIKPAEGSYFVGSKTVKFNIAGNSGDDSGNAGENPSIPDQPIVPVDPVYPVDPIDPVDPEEPEEPEEPTDPTEPEDPEEPDNPDEPVDPIEPADPVDPVDPVDPEEPTEPVDPTPEEPSDPVEPEDKDNQEGDWKKDHNGWWFHHKDGTYPSDEWVKVDGKWYHFDHHGYMQTGWIKQGGSWYYLKQDGSMATGWNHVNGEWYYCKGKGEGAEGSMATGWQEIDGKWYYLNISGVMQTGWQKQGNAWYHLADNGVMTTGWQHIDGVWYYLNEAGRMQTGWQEIDGAWHYLDNSGVMQTGWLQQGNKWYYLSSNGQMATDWQKVGGKWYHMDDKGHMQTGWQEIDGKWYYMNASGVMQTNCWVGNYWVDASGAMATNTTVDNGRYQVDENGRWVK